MKLFEQRQSQCVVVADSLMKVHRRMKYRGKLLFKFRIGLGLLGAAQRKQFIL